MTLQELKSAASKLLIATRSFVESGLNVQTMCFIFQADGPMLISPTPLENTHHKEWMTQELIRISKLCNVEGVVWIGDAWSLQVKNAEEMFAVVQEGIANHPLRQEALSVTVLVQGQVVSMAEQRYHRNPVRWGILEWKDTQ